MLRGKYCPVSLLSLTSEFSVCPLQSEPFLQLNAHSTFLVTSPLLFLKVSKLNFTPHPMLYSVHIRLQGLSHLHLNGGLLPWDFHCSMRKLMGSECPLVQRAKTSWLSLSQCRWWLWVFLFLFPFQSLMSKHTSLPRRLVLLYYHDFLPSLFSRSTPHLPLLC